ncbi:MAG: hypothetical protein ABI321_08050 [Polyangia bacterium]
MQLRLFVLLASLFLLLTSREPPWADSHVVYDTTESFVEHHDFAVRLEGGPPWFYARPDGKLDGPKYGVFPLGNVLAMVPSYLAYKVLRQIPGVPDRPLNAMICHLSPALLMAAACLLFYRLVRRRVPDKRRESWAVGLTLVLAFCTISFIYARSAYAEALQTFALTWLVERTLVAARRPTVATLGWIGVAAGVLVSAKLVFVLVLPMIVAYLGWARFRAGDLGKTVLRSWLALVEFGAFIALALWHNHIKTGNILSSGYTMRGGLFSGDVLAAVHGFLLSPGKGVLWYSPPLMLGVVGLRVAWKRYRAETLLQLGIVVSTILFNAKFRIWHADYCWGPRHLAPLSPIVLLWATPWLPEALARGRRRLRLALTYTVVAMGLCVQLLGASLYWDHYIRVLVTVKDQTGASGWFRESFTHAHYIPSFSPLIGQWWLLRHLVTADPDLDRDPPWRSIMPSHAHLGDAWSRLRLDWWPLEWMTNKEPWRPGMRPPGLRGDPPQSIAATVIAFGLLACAAYVCGRGVRSRLR